MKKRNSILSAISLVFVSVLFSSQVALADSPSFTYIGAEYVPSAEIEVSDDNLSFKLDASGYAINASAELGIFFIQASRTNLESDEELFGIRAEDNSTSLALGLTFELPQTQIYGLVRGRYDEIEFSSIFEDEDGGIVGGEVGIRVNVTNFLELNANIGKPSADDGESYGFGAQFFVTDNLGITANVSSISAERDDIEASFDTASLGLRYTF